MRAVAVATTGARIISATATAMATKVSRAVPRRPAEVVVKITISLVGIFAVAWGGWSLPVFKAEASPQFVAAKIFHGDSYKMPRLLLTERQAEAVAASYPFCNPAALHSLTAIRLGIFKNNNRRKQSDAVRVIIRRVGRRRATDADLFAGRFVCLADAILDRCRPAWIDRRERKISSHVLCVGAERSLDCAVAESSELLFSSTDCQMIFVTSQSMTSSIFYKPDRFIGKWQRYLKIRLTVANAASLSACKRPARYPVRRS